mmetsp:Transcript_43206/g.101607  ORF Transcript_43206/g.101607 Transcript_43206/m.101607 type:complete len:495 (+) Transcript_43206:94-1578(+)
MAAPQVEVISQKCAGAEEHLHQVLFRVNVPDKPAGGIDARTPTDIVCVIDISGSMGSLATIQSASGVVESNGLTLLDVAKHGVRTVIATLGPSDRCAVVAFDDQQVRQVPLTKMDEAGKAHANKQLEALDDRGGTDIWGGLREGMEVLREAQVDKTESRIAHVVLLTDGQTMRRDEVLPNVRSYKAQYEGLPGTVSTMGFGYSIDSELLADLAQCGNGTYSFIPDAGFVGTVFVNTMSNLLVSMATDVMLDIGAEDGAVVEKVHGGIEYTQTADAWRLQLGLLQYGQSRDTVVSAKLPAGANLTARLTCKLAGSGALAESDLAELKAESASEAELKLVQRQVQRCDFVDTVQSAVKELKAWKGNDTEGVEQAAGKIRALAERVSSSQAAGDEHVQKLLEDIQGQILEAFSKREYWFKWGCHYVPSALCAHKCQVCNNFKDPGVQVYGGDMFKDFQDKADNLFNELPPPTASDIYQVGATAAPVDMSRYNDRDCA